ncbi:S41 family peptidase [Achromobacter sp. 79A6]|uniref:S41 family peptidase n=1 Tax=unclassified Achromobacter TaxID=2626865 RepID=UPI0021F179B8
MRRSAIALFAAGLAAWTAPASAQPREQVEGTLTAALTQLLNQYVDPVDTRALAMHGLRALPVLPGEADAARKAAIDQAVTAEGLAADIPEQSRILADQILRFADGPPRAAALNAALRGMMASLDAYSRVATAAELAPPPASVGLELSIQNGALTVMRPLPGGPGERAGLRTGDVISHIDGRATAGLPLSEAVALLRGATGTRPTLRIQRPGAPDLLTVQPVRGPVQAPPSVRWDMNGAVAVVTLAAFDSKTDSQLRAALDAAAARAGSRLGGLVLDLRGNAGGLLDVAEQVAGVMLRKGSRIGNLYGRTPADSRALVARDSLLPHDVPVVVIVDRRTGAGAEIVAAALQDHGRALVIGEKTAGAGTIQTVLPLPANEGALVVTSARVHRANGARLEGAGVTPQLLIDAATGKMSLRADVAADFNADMAERLRAALASAPANSDPALLAALTALK